VELGFLLICKSKVQIFSVTSIVTLVLNADTFYSFVAKLLYVIADKVSCHKNLYLKSWT